MRDCAMDGGLPPDVPVECIFSPCWVRQFAVDDRDLRLERD